jgi:hypothetical protein
VTSYELKKRKLSEIRAKLFFNKHPCGATDGLRRSGADTNGQLSEIRTEVFFNKHPCGATDGLGEPALAPVNTVLSVVGFSYHVHRIIYYVIHTYTPTLAPLLHQRCD